MRRHRRSTILTVLILWVTACGGKTKGPSGDLPSGTVEQDSAVLEAVGTVAWIFQGFPRPFTAEHGDDGVTFTNGRMLLKVIPVIDGFALSDSHKKLSSAIVSNRYLLFKSLNGSAGVEAGLSEADRMLVTGYCSNIGVSLAGGAVEGPLESEVFEIRWRSHFPAGQAEKLGLHLLSVNADFRCGLEFGLQYPGATATSMMTLVFDPTPEFDPVKIHPADVYAGTDRFAVARDETILLPEVRGHKLEAFEDGWEKTLVTTISEVIPAVIAINANDFVLGEVHAVVGDTCELRLSDALKVENPAGKQIISYKVPEHPKRSSALDAISNVDLPGATGSPACKNLGFQKTESGDISINLTCLQVQQIVDTGDCGLKLVFSNPDDVGNTVEVRAKLEGFKYSLLDLGKPENAITLLPRSEANPVREGIITMTSFSVGQTVELAKSFDLWQAVASPSYDSFFKLQITEIEFDSGSANCLGAGAYAQLNGSKIFWCPGGGMASDALTVANSPNYLVYRAATALHESLHAFGNPHDIDAPGNQPCSSVGGTAYSAIIPVETYNCVEDYCYGFKELAREEFLLELNYSLKNDARRFQGQCDVWAKQLGVAF